MISDSEESLSCVGALREASDRDGKRRVFGAGWKRGVLGIVPALSGAAVAGMPLTVLAVAFVFCGCATVPLAGSARLWIRKGGRFEIAQSSKAMGWGFYSHPFLFDCGPDELYLKFNAEGDKLAAPHFTMRSRDRGRTWVSHKEECSHPLSWYWTSIFRTKDGTPSAALAYGVSGGVDWSTEKVFYRWGTNGWGTPFRAATAGPDVPGLYWPSAVGVEDSSGGLMVGVYTGFMICGTVLIRSDDGGSTWRYHSTVATTADAPWGSEGPSEPTLLLLPTGELVCIMRTGGPGYKGRGGFSEPLLEARSRDGGRTWKHRRMSISGVMPKLLRMSNGVLVLATGRPGNVLYFSTDNGRSWPRSVALTPADVQTSGYCDIVEVSPGRLLAVYDLYDTDPKGFWLWEPKEVNGVFGVFVSVRQLL